MHPGYFPVFFWSLLILVSFWGYGELLRRRINRPEFADIGWGLTCAWGVSVVLAVGGILMALRLAKAQNLTLVVLFGAAAAFYYAVQRAADFTSSKSKVRNSKFSASGRFILHPSSFILYGLALLTFASSIAWPFQIDPNDDLICYLMLPEKILQTGTLIDPFSFRRPGSLGGHWFLEALVMIVGADRSGHVVDSGIARIVLFGIVLGLPYESGRLGSVQRWVLALVALLYPIPRINTMSALTGSTTLLALAVTLSKVKPTGTLSSAFLSWLPVALMVGCASLMRPYFALAAAGLFLLGWMVYAKDAKHPPQIQLILLVTALATQGTFQ